MKEYLEFKISRIKPVWIPVWAITELVKLFLPRNHPWYGRRFTLQSWVDGGTSDALWFAIFFWVSAFSIACVAYFLFAK